MKNLTKPEVKKQIAKLLNETISKVIKIARKNGYEIANPDWNYYSEADFEEFESVEQMIDKDSEVMFRNENNRGFREILADIYYNELTLVSKADIEKFCHQYDSARKTYIAQKNDMNAKKKADRAAKIALLRKQLAKLEAEEAV